MIKFSVETSVLFNSGPNFVEISLHKKNYISTPSYFRYFARLSIVLLIRKKLQNTEIQDSHYLYRNSKNNNKINFNPGGNLKAILSESESFRESAALKNL